MHTPRDGLELCLQLDPDEGVKRSKQAMEPEVGVCSHIVLICVAMSTFFLPFSSAFTSILLCLGRRIGVSPLLEEICNHIVAWPDHHSSTIPLTIFVELAQRSLDVDRTPAQLSRQRFNGAGAVFKLPYMRQAFSASNCCRTSCHAIANGNIM